MPGVFEVSRDLPIGRVIDDLLLLVAYSIASTGSGKLRYDICRYGDTVHIGHDARLDHNWA
jgi:hypothetical protein